MTDIHSCSYYCSNPACIKAQRDSLRSKYVKLMDDYEKLATANSLVLSQNHEHANVYAHSAVFKFQDRLANAIEKLPFGDTAASFAVFVREFK